MSPDATPEPGYADPLDGRGGIANVIVPTVTGAIGLLAGYLIWGTREAPKPVATNTGTALYAPDANEAPARLGTLAARNLPTLDEWDALDPFDGGFPLPPDDWAAPLLALNPPIPAVPQVASAAPLPGDRPGGGGSPFVDTPMPPSLGRDIGPLPPMRVPGELLPTNPPVGTTPDGTVPPAQAAETAPALITATLNGVNERAAASTISALGGKYGGAARTFTHMTPEGEVEAEGVLLLVAPSDASKAVADIRKLGALGNEDRSEGSAKSRQSRLSAPFVSRLASLRKRREELLVQFLEDADPIKQIDGAINQEAKALSAVRLSGAADRLTAIRIFLKP